MCAESFFDAPVCCRDAEFRSRSRSNHPVNSRRSFGGKDEAMTLISLPRCAARNEDRAKPVEDGEHTEESMLESYKRHPYVLYYNGAQKTMVLLLRWKLNVSLTAVLCVNESVCDVEICGSGNRSVLL